MNATSLADHRTTSMEHSAATERVWQEMHERLLSYIRRRVAVHDAEDILQDVFVRIHSNLARLKDTECITAWVYQIARNAITDYRRKQAAGDRALAKLAEKLDEADGAADEGDDTVRQARDDFARCMEPLMSELPEHYRQAVTLTELKGMKQTEAARKLGLSVSGMKARVQRGRGKLKQAILDCCAVQLDRRGGLVDYHRRDGSTCEGCSCD